MLLAGDGLARFDAGRRNGDEGCAGRSPSGLGAGGDGERAKQAAAFFGLGLPAAFFLTFIFGFFGFGGVYCGSAMYFNSSEKKRACFLKCKRSFSSRLENSRSISSDSRV